MVTPVGYTTPFMGLIQRKGRSGWYLQVAVPREHRQRLGRDHFIRKAGNTHSEAAANRSRLMQEIEAEFLNLKGTGSLVKRYESSYRVNSLVELNCCAETHTVWSRVIKPNIKLTPYNCISTNQFSFFSKRCTGHRE